MIGQNARIIRSTAPSTKVPTRLTSKKQQRYIKTASEHSQSAAALAAAPSQPSLTTNLKLQNTTTNKSASSKFSYFDVVMPAKQTAEQMQKKVPLMEKISQLPIVQSLVNSKGVVREEFYWPIGKRRIAQAPETFLYGALSGSNDLPLAPLVFRWKSGCLPDHLSAEQYFGGFGKSGEEKKWLKARVPGVTSIQYIGTGLAFNGAGDNATTTHPGVSSALLDEITARVSISNTPDKPTFTANFKIDYIEPILAGRFVVLDAWLTGIEGRKTIIASQIADALNSQVLVRAKSLFVSAA
ncbi:hypothetical protein GGI25_000903 [Coemansia spiralis]|uniref:Thioesterase domain-containing protein n=2 Tax=Coemansia TaxID=4863 RepID=A0A9W8GDJ0_9FUNG|nr:hypothetical protein BX070DRAFT_223279 [Coemansia spiralis]KAJ1994060.1 hypothetical protein EDC05_001730 [Coemansia umbellata]KAJ2623640.1 hypothetical protein GGI26_002278 [Coemansia sp. RSA 1358]KAJ2680310.1 hypothetical protein GGI25_000903 [Coemansia spiralis]